MGSRKVSANQAQPATYADLQRAMSERTEDILEAVAIRQVQLSIPLDDAGPRICVSVMPADVAKVPGVVHLKLGRRQIDIPIEVRDDYETFEAL
jgi:hypothetical protein